jgi:hypothetical protein
VALLLRYSNGNLLLFEATGETGVALTDWNDFITQKWYNLYDKIAYRKLYCERTPELMHNLQNFIRVNTITKIIQTRFHWERSTRSMQRSFVLKERGR